MNGPLDLIGEARARGRKALSEYDSKRFLSFLGIPVVPEAFAPDGDSAALEAARIGFPVVLKAYGENLFHKTEVGGVVLNLRSQDEVREEGNRLLKIRGCEGLLVQQMAEGRRELACGLTRDPVFGPCVMFGLGGILTELLGDVVFRIAPLSLADAQEMMGQIRGRKVMESFRGEPPADRHGLARVLVALGEIGLRYEEVAEVDINPLRIRSDGRPVALDALVVLRPGGTVHG
ncbi:MAG: acetate--CoA ligase family protein [Deltaproteobacteria bacterium]|nr:acetate--CoA ligase family protein [Deltaproteobacteria bacterium]MBW2122693.1 acetate--CoA ligase family protein [Deltaproteobacteria bacterium]